MPAKAGIHCAWIPAFAGMTGTVIPATRKGSDRGRGAVKSMVTRDGSGVPRRRDHLHVIAEPKAKEDRFGGVAAVHAQPSCGRVLPDRDPVPSEVGGGDRRVDI